jgi:hypothetical protein
MATMTLSILRDGAVEPLSFSVLLADADVDRISVAYAAMLFPNGVVETPATETDPAVVRPPTGGEVLSGVAMRMVQQLGETASSWHKKQAIRAAEASATPITITPVE